MHTSHVICYIVAAVCFALAAINVPATRVNLIALGLLAWVLVPLSEVVR